MEAFSNLCQLPDRQLTHPEHDVGSIQHLGRRVNPNGRSQPLGNSEKLLNFFWTYFPVPLSKAPTKIQWLKDNVLIKFNERHNIFKDNISLFERQVAVLSLPQLYNHLKIGVPLFSATEKLDDFYETLDDSINKLNEFLDFQFTVSDKKKEFIDFLYLLLNKSSGKKNCLTIVGPPSSGKTYFARIVKEALVVSGMIANMNNRSNFPLNNCLNKRVLHWDEPSFDPGSQETIKCLFSGDELSTSVKYQDNGSIMRTPVIATSNTYVWPRSAAFDCRVETYNFHQMSALKDWRPLNPMCLYSIFEQYNLM